MAFPEHDPSLLPGLPDDIALDLVAKKMPWPICYSMSSLSKSWQRSFPHPEVYRARVSNHSTETLVVITHLAANYRTFREHEISIYSSRQRKFYKLPALPPLPTTSHFSDIFTSGSKIYLVVAENRCQCHDCTRKWFGEYSACIPCNPCIPAFQFDLAGQWEWIECTPSQAPQRDGNRRGFQAPDGMKFEWFSVVDFELEEPQIIHPPIYPSCIHALVEFPVSRLTPTFRVNGRLYRMSFGPRRQIEFYDTDRELWSLQHSISSNGFEREILPPYEQINTALTVDYLLIVPVDNELLALARWSCNGRLRNRRAGYGLLQSSGFGTDSPEIVWKKIPHTFMFSAGYTFAMCSIDV